MAIPNRDHFYANAVIHSIVIRNAQRTRMNTTYLLDIELKTHKTIAIGKLGCFQFEKGRYVYVGSARKNFSQRIARHLRAEKKIHWHIDYLLQHARISKIWSCDLSEEKAAHLLSRMMSVPVPRFGARDKKSKAHLFFGKPGHPLTGLVLTRVF